MLLFSLSPAEIFMNQVQTKYIYYNENKEKANKSDLMDYLKYLPKDHDAFINRYVNGSKYLITNHILILIPTYQFFQLINASNVWSIFGASNGLN